MQASYQQYILNFKQASGTSRGILKTKETWFLMLSENGMSGVGECAIFRGLSVDDRPDYEQKLQWVCTNINLGLGYLLSELIAYPSIQFGLEQAFLSLQSEDSFLLYPSNFTSNKDSIPINGLVWMGEKQFMKTQIIEKIDAGFSCIKLKIGAIDFNTELDLLAFIRNEFAVDNISIRVDANGGFLPDTAIEKLKRLSDYDIHSIEQPIKQQQPEEMAKLCLESPVPIALDEELIGVLSSEKKAALLKAIQPQYIILKPSLIGGFAKSDEWITLAEQDQIGWWITSALESNVGLNAIAQYTYNKHNKLPQGLGTGGLFTNNFESPLTVKNGDLHYNSANNWNFNL